MNEFLLRYLLRNNTDTKGNKFSSMLTKFNNSILLEIFWSEIIPYNNNFIFDMLYLLKEKFLKKKVFLKNIIKK